MPELQEPFKKLEFRASELGHFRAVLRTAQNCQERAQKNLDQIVADVLFSCVGKLAGRRTATPILGYERSLNNW
jgi:hypothetical protein